MISAADIEAAVDGELIGDPGRVIHALATLENGNANSVGFISDKKFLGTLENTQCGLVLVNSKLAIHCKGDHIVTEDPYLGYARISGLFDPEPVPEPGIHPTAIISETARLGAGVSIGPNVVIGEQVIIGENCSLAANVVVGEGAELGKDCRLEAGVVLYHNVVLGDRVRIHSGSVIGSHGFGYANQQGRWVKIAQIGRVVIDDDVEIGANCAIDRGAINDTYIRQGVKLDNLVHMAHNVEVGEHSALAAQVGIAGSAKIGARNMVAGQAGISGHIETVDNCVFTGQAMITGNVDSPGVYSSGIGLMPAREWRKMVARLRHLDDLARQVKRLEKKIEEKDN